MPLLGFYATLIAMIGGGLLAAVSLGIPPITFIARIREVVPITDLYVGLIKAPCSARSSRWRVFPGNAGRGGRRAGRPAHDVGGGAGNLLVIVLDAFFAVFFTWLGWD